MKQYVLNDSINKKFKTWQNILMIREVRIVITSGGGIINQERAQGPFWRAGYILFLIQVVVTYVKIH